MELGHQRTLAPHGSGFAVSSKSLKHWHETLKSRKPVLAALLGKAQPQTLLEPVLELLTGSLVRALLRSLILKGSA